MSELQIDLVLALVFVAVVLVVFAVIAPASGKSDMRRRLALDTSVAGAGPSLVDDPLRSLWARLIVAVEKRGVSLTDGKGEELAERLMLAGYAQPYAVRAFVLIKTCLTLGFALLAFLLMYFSGPQSLARFYLFVGGAASIGLYLPNFVVNSRATARRKEILDGFPDTLDLMLVCVEAGLAIDATFARVGAEIATSHPLLAELLANVSLELRAGRSREIALRTLARRTALPEFVAFVTLVNQSAKLGSSIGLAFKVYAGEMRESRRMRAEEKAARLPVLLSVPLVAFLLPTMVSVLMLPAVITVRNNLSHVAVGKR